MLLVLKYIVEYFNKINLENLVTQNLIEIYFPQISHLDIRYDWKNSIKIVTNKKNN